MPRSLPAALGTALVLLTGFVVVGSVAEPTTAGDRVLAESRRAVAAVKSTRYSHKTEIDETAGSYVTDCSGFVCWVMKRTAPAHLDAMKIFNRRIHPLAEDFYAIIHESNGERGFNEITAVADARPGDILAWRLTAADRKNTGHVVVLNGKPVFESNKLWRVAIIDATGKPHADDTRPEGTSGLGAGTIWITVDPAGRPRGIHSRDPGAKPNMLPIAIGRLVPINPDKLAALKVEPATTRPWLQPAKID